MKQKTPGTFEIIKQSRVSKARAGRLHTTHGIVETPVFMPVGTQAAIKSLTPDMVNELGAQIILANTYHLSLRPGETLIKSFNGLHDFMNWKKPILTDSGGFQVFSLSNMRKITDDGVTFKSLLDGSKQYFTPKRVIDLQLSFNSDILMPLDICSPHTHSYQQAKADLTTTTKWQKEASHYWKSKDRDNLLFGIVQGGMYQKLRQQSTQDLVALDLPGYAIGGVCVGETAEQLTDVFEWTTPLLPIEKPRYLMGVGLPKNLPHAINNGIDMFDCVAPTRLARHGHFFNTNGKGNIRNKQYQHDHTPLDNTCNCYTCKHYSKAYLRHLFIAKELLALTLISYHNLYTIIQQVKSIRQSILEE